MPDEKPAFSFMSANLHVVVHAMPALTEPSDSDLPAAILALTSAIDRVDLACPAKRTGPVAVADKPDVTIGEYLKARREIAGLTVQDLALRLNHKDHLKFADRLSWIIRVESGEEYVASDDMDAVLAAITKDLSQTGWGLQLIRNQQPSLATVE